MEEVVPGIRTWSVLSEEKGYAFNGYALETAEGTVLIDPPGPDGSGWDPFDEMAPYEGVYLSNRNHGRAAGDFRERYGVAVKAHEADLGRLALEPDEVLRGGETVAGRMEVVHVPGKSPGEIAFHLPGASSLIVGDLVIGVPAGWLSTYPEDVVDDMEQLFRSLEKLLEYDFEALLVCDGEPLLRGGKERLRRFLESRRG